MWGIETPDPGEPTRLLAEGDTIEVGDICLQVIETPGHTPGGIVLFAATEQGNIAFVGDTLFPGSHGRTDLSGGDEAAILRSLSKLAQILPPDTVCLTGHGDSTTDGARAYAEPVSCRCRLCSQSSEAREASKRQAIFPNGSIP